MKPDQRKQIKILSELQDYKKAETRYFLNKKAILKINNYLKKYKLTLKEISGAVIERLEFYNRFYIFEVIDTQRNVVPELIAWNIQKAADKLRLTFYQIESKNLHIKKWRKLGFKKADNITYNAPIKFKAVYYLDQKTKKYTFTYTDISSDYKTKAKKNIGYGNALNLQYIMYYEFYRHTIIQDANISPPASKNLKRADKSFDINFIKGNEHIKYNRSGAHIIDLRTGAEYKSIAECSRINHFDYWLFYRGLQKNDRFKRFNS